MTKIETKHIRTDGGTQARAGLNNEKVNEYKELLRDSGGEWPFKDPIVVFYDGTDYWLADGFHRFHACWTGGRYVVEADVRQGTRREAQLYAAGANAEHGLPRTAEDKKRAVTLLLEDAEWGKWSDREIARRCKVSHPFVAKIREETGIVTSERVYTDRHGNEAVMDTAGIAKANEDRVFAPVNIGGKPAHPPQTAVTIPKMWEEWGAPVSSEQTAAPSPFYVGPMAQGPEVREALDRYLDQWPVNRNFITMRLANVESSGHDKEMQDAVAALGASDSAIYHQAMVLRNDLPGPSWERGEQAGRPIETAVSSPAMAAIMADVDAYEAETAQLFAPAPAPRRATHTDTRLANLDTALDLVTRLTADKSLTIDIVGPLARALMLMEDAKKALTKRQQYITWLRDYQDDDGRRWTDLTDNQTWHKNSPCYQAFAKAFPGESLARSALMDAKQQLEKETAVVQEVSA